MNSRLTSSKHVIVVDVHPLQFQSIPGGNATFYCISFAPLDLLGVQWYINDQPLVNSSNVVIKFSNIGNGLGLLQLTNLSQTYDMARIQCNAVLNSGMTVASSNAAMLFISEGL